MSAHRGRVLIEFTKDTEARRKGARLYVDPQSAVSFVEKKKVAKVLTEKEAEQVEKERTEAPEETGTVGGVG